LLFGKGEPSFLHSLETVLRRRILRLSGEFTAVVGVLSVLFRLAQHYFCRRSAFSAKVRIISKFRRISSASSLRQPARATVWMRSKASLGPSSLLKKPKLTASMILGTPHRDDVYSAARCTRCRPGDDAVMP
jgi:hypothetical protein